MKFLKRFFLIFAILMCAVFAIFLVDSVQVSADILDQVRLTKEQTLALYGTTISASYYTGSDWLPCTFEYFASSSSFSPSDHITSVISYNPNSNSDGTYAGYSTEQEFTSMIRDSDFLFYRLALPNPAPAERDILQFSLDFSVPISGIAFYRQIVACGCASGVGDSSSEITAFPLSDGFSISNFVSYSPTPVVRFAKSIKNSWADSSDHAYSRFVTPVQLITTNSGPRHKDVTFCFSDISLRDVDSQTGLENTFSISAQTFDFNRAAQYNLEVSSNSGEFYNYYLIAISAPIVTDGYILPEPPQTTSNYSSQLDSLVNSSAQNTSILQQILAKLDLIYQKMQQGESSPTLQDPEHIGFDSRTKQEILDGLQDGAAVLDSQSVPEQAQQVGGAVWDISGRLLDCAPGLAGVYMFIFILGIVSWVIYGKRGG